MTLGVGKKKEKTVWKKRDRIKRGGHIPLPTVPTALLYSLKPVFFVAFKKKKFFCTEHKNIYRLHFC